MSASPRGCESEELSTVCGVSLGVPNLWALVTLVGVRDLSLLASSQLWTVSSLSFRCNKSESDGFFLICERGSAGGGNWALGAVGVDGWDLNKLNHFLTPSRFIGSLPREPELLAVGEMTGGGGVLGLSVGDIRV